MYTSCFLCFLPHKLIASDVVCECVCWLGSALFSRWNAGLWCNLWADILCVWVYVLSYYPQSSGVVRGSVWSSGTTARKRFMVSGQVGLIGRIVPEAAGAELCIGNALATVPGMFINWLLFILKEFNEYRVEWNPWTVKNYQSKKNEKGGCFHCHVNRTDFYTEIKMLPGKSILSFNH